MREVDLDYVARRRPLPWLGLTLLAAALAMAAELGLSYRGGQLELARLDGVAALAPAKQRPSPAIAPERLAEEEAKTAEAVVRQLTLPWGALIRAIEEAGSREVALLQLQPDAESRTLRLTAEAVDAKAMLDYLRSLAAAPALEHVHISSHHVRRDDPRRPVHFSVHATLR